jgi:hypothetical protein
LTYSYGSAWLQYQDQMILTSKSSRVSGRDGDKNQIFSKYADGKKANLFVSVTANSTNGKLQQVVSSCADDAKSIPPSNNFWTQ